jgi:[heparan sulfate]-glucosamine 3-sulfotransferase 5
MAKLLCIFQYAQIIENQRYRGLEGRPFESVALNPDGSVNEHYDAVEKSLYSLHMAKWLKVFPQSQMHVVNGEKLVRKPWHELRKVEDFLGLEHEIEPEMFAFNATKGFHCIVTTGNDSVRRERCLTKAKGRAHPRIGKDVISKLRKFFAPFNYDFYTMAGTDFGWPEH